MHGPVGKKIEKDMHKKVLGEAKEMKGPTSGKSGFAKGGEIDCPDCCDGMPCEMHGEQGPEHELDMVGRIMQKLSKGGEVANADEIEADFMPNEFDDLHLRDGLEFHETGANEGDELGDPEPDKHKNDMVARIMMKRRKQSNPRPA